MESTVQGGDSSKIGSIVNTLILTLVSVSLIVVVFWALFYSVLLANFSFVIRARATYQDIYWGALSLIATPSKTFPPFEPIYTIESQNWSDGYLYTLLGKYDNIDPERGLVAVRGYDGKIYTFKTTKKFQGEGFVESDLAPESDIVSLGGTAFSNQSQITVRWDDKRTLYQLMQDYNKNPSEPLNINSLKYFYFRRIN